MVRQYSRRAYRCALENFTSCGKFWKIVKFWKPAVGQPLDSPAVAIRVIFARSDSMVRKVAFFYNVAFCDLSYNKNRNRIWKILGAPHNYFQLLVLVVGYMKNLAALVFSGVLTFPAFQLLPNFQNFPAYDSAFPAATAATAAAFPAFWRRPSCVATGAAAQIGMASSWNYARLVKFGRIVKIWKS